MTDTEPPATLPENEVPIDAPRDPLVDTIIRLERVIGSLSDVSKELIEVARDVSLVRTQQRQHGLELGKLGGQVDALEQRVCELESNRRESHATQ